MFLPQIAGFRQITLQPPVIVLYNTNSLLHEKEPSPVKKEVHLTAVTVTSEDVIQRLLDTFEAKTDIHVVMKMVGWETYRGEFVQMALHKTPGDVAMVGAPITSDLIGMNALRPFSTSEIYSMGGNAAFLPSRWQSAIRPGSPDVWAVPWVLDIRMIYFWRDLMEQAGVDEAQAFADADHMEDTLARLQSKHGGYPLAVPHDRYSLLHLVSSFIWAEGSDLFTEDGKRVIFHEEAGLRGIRRYFQMLRFANPNLLETWVNRAPFNQREVAVMVGNGWAAFSPSDENIGSAAILGQSYVGGTDLMIWQHSRNESAALDLVRFLTHPETVLELNQSSELLPMRVQQIEAMAADSKPIRRSIARAALSGHTFPCVSMVGLIEDRLSVALLNIQQELFKNPAADLDAQLDALLRSRIVALGNRTNLSLGA